MKVLITGSRGMLGRDLVPCLTQAGFEVMGVDIKEMDITMPDEVLNRLETVQPGLVINCAAYTEVDKAETEPALAFAVNSDGSGYLANACRRLGVPLIHISTDYVFDGRKKKPYREEDRAEPLGVYGRSKWEGEEKIRTLLKEHIIIRTSWTYGIHGKNFVKTILKLAGEMDELRVVADQYGSPTWTVDLCRAIKAVAVRITDDRKEMPWGTYHFSGKGITTWYDFARNILEQASLLRSLKTKKLISIKTSEYPTRAKRPEWSVLDCAKIEKVFRISPRQWHCGLAVVLGACCKDQ
ncbi:MAG: dTDP-4-dehydrorhamnose reductase [Deltaproteobacteria bacterium]|nr:dTDP-4-dehydrorhamnose reductase [Deltaproteobacteria bacterium]